jgi:hypothetical protein
MLGGYVVRDANGQALAFVCDSDAEARRAYLASRRSRRKFATTSRRQCRLTLSLQRPQFAIRPHDVLLGGLLEIGTEKGRNGIFGHAFVFGGDLPIAAGPDRAVTGFIEHHKLPDQLPAPTTHSVPQIGKKPAGVHTGRRLGQSGLACRRGRILWTWRMAHPPRTRLRLPRFGGVPPATRLAKGLTVPRALRLSSSSSAQDGRSHSHVLMTATRSFGAHA